MSDDWQYWVAEGADGMPSHLMRECGGKAESAWPGSHGWQPMAGSPPRSESAGIGGGGVGYRRISEAEARGVWQLWALEAGYGS